MGVSGLQTWAEEHAKLGRRVTLQHDAVPKTIIVDAGAGMLELFSHKSLVGDFDALRRSVRQFVAQFAAVNVRLVVVIDGVVPLEKFGTWLSRRRKEVRAVAQLNAACRGGAGERSKGFVWLPPAFSQTYLGQAFRDAGCDVVFSAVEADREVAGLALQLNAFGVLGYDSDYLVLPCGDECLYLSLHSLGFNRGSRVLTATAFRRRDVFDRLCLPARALPLLAAALGFDLHKRSRALVSELELLVDASHVVEVAAATLRRRIAAGGTEALEPRDAREVAALEWFTPAAVPGYTPGDKSLTRPHVATLLRRATFVGPLCFENLSPPYGESIFHATRQLRAAVYARLFRADGAGAAQPPPCEVVTELLCSARRPIDDWAWEPHDFSGSPRALHPSDVLARAGPGVPRAVALARHVVERWLLPNHVSAAHAAALVAQAHPETRAQVADAGFRPSQLRRVRPADAHAASLFLVAMDCFLWAAGENEDAPVWELFCGPTFHVLCDPPLANRRSYLSAATKLGGAPPAVRVDGQRPPPKRNAASASLLCCARSSLRACAGGACAPRIRRLPTHHGGTVLTVQPMFGRTR